jgi:hypothetical protein
MEAKTAYAKSKRSRRRSRGAESGARRLAAALPLRRTAARPTRRMIASRRGTVLRRGAQRSPPRLRIAIAPPGASGAVQDGRRGVIPTFGSDRPRIAPPGASGAVQDRANPAIPTSGSDRPRIAPPGASGAVQDGRRAALPTSGSGRPRLAPPGAAGAVPAGGRGVTPTSGAGRPRLAPPGASGAVQDGRRGVIPTFGSDRPRLAPPGAAQTDAPPPHLLHSDRCPPPHRSPSGKRLPGHLPGSDRCPPLHRSFSGGRCCTAYNRRPRASILRGGVSCGNLSQKETTHAPAAPEHAMGVKSEMAGTIWLEPCVPASLTPTHFPAACRGGSGAAVSHCSGHASSCQVKS